MTVNNNKDISISQSSILSYRDRASEIYVVIAIKRINILGASPLTWPLKSLMTSYMIQITIWSDRDRQDEQFHFYDLCQHMNNSKDICQKHQPLLGPLFKGPAPIFWHRSKGLVISNIICSTRSNVKNHRKWRKIVASVSFRFRRAFRQNDTGQIEGINRHLQCVKISRL